MDRLITAVDLEIGLVYSGETHLLRPLLRSIGSQRAGPRVRILLVDNGTRRAVGVTGPFRGVRVLSRPTRRHYGANMNDVLRQATAPLVLLINTDMLLAPQADCLGRMVQFMKNSPKCGVATCRIIHPDGGEAYAARRYPGWRSILARRAPGWLDRFSFGRFARWRGRHLRRHLYLDHRPHETFACQWVSGCFMLIRREVIEDIGLFDEAYGRYFQDVDYCLRAWQAGWQVMHYGKTYAHHLERRASQRVWSRAAWEHLRAFVRWQSKWPPRRRSATSFQSESAHRSRRAVARSDQDLRTTYRTRDLPLPPRLYTAESLLHGCQLPARSTGDAEK